MAENFEFTYSAARQEEVEAIRKKYLPKTEDKMETLRKLDKKVERPGTVVSLALGIIGALVMGTGMSCCLVWGDRLFTQGLVIGVIGMIVAGIAYPMYKKITAKKRAEYAEQILTLANELAVN